MIFLINIGTVIAQDTALHTKTKKYSLHWQATVIPQYHFDFKAPYTGDNSMEPSEPVKTSFTTTFFLSYKPCTNTYLVFDPEAAGGKGLSKTLGVAGFPNGEIYRVGDPAPKPFIARLYAEHRFPLSKKKAFTGDDQNQVAETTNTEYISVIAGKFALTDFFDNSDISHDPRTQFMNWSLMGEGAWDYAANTRGYTFGVVAQALYHDWAFRVANVAMPIEANGQDLQYKPADASSYIAEIEKTHLFRKDDRHFTTLHAGAFLNKEKMGNYALAIQQAMQTATTPDVTATRMYGRSKWGFYLSLDNNFGNIHHFIKGSWNDGKNETWAFTEIDRSVATGLSFDGKLWNRKHDHLGIAYVVNGISKDHRDYLSLGGYGFIIGDGALNYGTEQIVETYYNFYLWKIISISPDYQFVLHPAYNKDRGPVHIVGLRLHVEL